MSSQALVLEIESCLGKFSSKRQEQLIVIDCRNVHTMAMTFSGAGH